MSYMIMKSLIVESHEYHMPMLNLILLDREEVDCITFCCYNTDNSIHVNVQYTLTCKSRKFNRKRKQHVYGAPF